MENQPRSVWTQILPLICGLVIGGLIVYIPMRDNTPIQPVDISASEARADSVIKAATLHEQKSAQYRSSRDSARKALKNRPRHEKNNITSNAIARYLNDSILRANGYR